MTADNAGKGRPSPPSERGRGGHGGAGGPIYLTAAEASAELNISRATLYAYVSRGQIRSERASDSRHHLYRAEDVRALRAARGREDAESEGADALSWGAPILESAITSIGADGLFYRGTDACALARSSMPESVAALIWGASEDPFAEPLPDGVVAAFERARTAVTDLSPIDRAMALLPMVAGHDRAAFADTKPALIRHGVTLLRVILAVLAGRKPDRAPMATALAEGWGVTSAAAERLIRMALILSADHELNVSAFTVRCTVSAGSPLHAALVAGFAALQGFRHGGAIDRAGAMLDELAGARDIEACLVARLRRGDKIPGIGHPLYPAYDPRARLLLETLEEDFADAPVTGVARSAALIAQAMTGHEPNLDYAIAALVRGLGLDQRDGQSLFAAGRTVGWIGHAIEQVETGRLIRPRARYIGVRASLRRD